MEMMFLHAQHRATGELQPLSGAEIARELGAQSVWTADHDAMLQAGAPPKCPPLLWAAASSLRATLPHKLGAI